MDSDQVTSSETSINYSSNSENCRNVDDQYRNLPDDDEHQERERSNPELILNLHNVHPICDPASENEDSVEKLSAVLEQPEDSSTIVESVQSLMNNGESKSLHHILRQRIESLHEILKSLKDSLRTEVELWRKEREELQLLREKDNALALCEATAAARAAAAAYAAESPLSNNLGDALDLNPEDTFTELTILEYEKRLAKYQDMHTYNQAEMRYNACWKSIANIYKQKLLDIERLCNEELEKVQQNASTLQPLKEMVSQWYLDDKSRGDTIKANEMFANTTRIVFVNEDAYSGRQFRKIDEEANAKIFVDEFKSGDLVNGDRYYKQF
ncbi:uncharacterized protein LOC116429846 [Nomia melanderi]|uniref:uncharacterized protein LOC116429846 n=1 Tax=Nomia melanderi TaxID=2448451 RepID=UPI003FCE02F7